MAEEATITITKAEHDRLCEDSAVLNALRNAGVDNWQWYDDALATLGDG